MKMADQKTIPGQSQAKTHFDFFSIQGISESGQSTIEFAIATAMSLAFVFFFIHLSMLLAYGNLVHYATFMAARTYMAASDSVDDQVSRGQEILVRLLKKSVAQPGVDRYPFIARGDGGNGEIPGLIVLGPGPNFSPKNRNLSWQEGVRYKFRARIIPVPLSAGRGQDNVLTLISESWLGREPSTLDCERELATKLGGVTFDNGC